jgi:hypothetical protein
MLKIKLLHYITLLLHYIGFLHQNLSSLITYIYLVNRLHTFHQKHEVLRKLVKS